MVNYSICIVTYKAREFLRDCLNSIYSNPVQTTFEIIVVDNNSQDGTLEMLVSDFPKVKVISNTENDGYTKPMNQALRRTSGDFLIQLNPDTVLSPGFLDILFPYLQAHPEIGICSPKVLNGDGSMQWQCRRSEARPWDVLAYFTHLGALFPSNPRFSGYLMTHLSPDKTYEVQAVSGSCMIIRRSVIDAIGYLDEQFFAYQEDTEFCFRARQAGWKIVYLPLAAIIHFGSEGGTRVHPYRSVIEWHRSYFLYYRKCLAKDYFFLLNGLFYGLMALKLGAALIKTFFSREKYPGTRKPT